MAPELLFGPYKQPAISVGDDCFCERYGEVVCGGLVETPIAPWPRVKASGSHRLVLTGSLVDAVKRETNVAIQYWWNVSESTVTAWRKILGVPQHNEGTLKRCESLGKENIPAGSWIEANKDLRRRRKQSRTMRENKNSGHNYSKEEDNKLSQSSVKAAQEIGVSIAAATGRRRRKGLHKRRIAINSTLLFELIGASGHSRAKVAKLSGVCKSSLDKLAVGKRNGLEYESVLAISETLGVRPIEIIETKPFSGDYYERLSKLDKPDCPVCGCPLTRRKSTAFCGICSRQYEQTHLLQVFHRIPADPTTRRNREIEAPSGYGYDRRQKGGKHSGKIS